MLADMLGEIDSDIKNLTRNKMKLSILILTIFISTASVQCQDTASTKTILTLTKQVLTSVKNKDYKRFASFIHPILGVRFSPYGYADTLNDVKFTADKFLDAISKQTVFNWGDYDGSGDTILLTAVQYFGQFVYNADFLNAEKTGVNKILHQGNTLVNLQGIYKRCDFSESYFSGFDKKFGGMDWCSLRLVYKKYKSKYYLVGVMHDQWTI
jgi:hypothetical protein